MFKHLRACRSLQRLNPVVAGMRNKVCMGLLIWATVSPGQTNEAEVSKPLFSLPKPKLLALESESDLTRTNASAFGEPFQVTASIAQPVKATATTPEVALSSFESDFEYSVYLRMDKLGVFDRPELPSDSLIERSLNAVFAPEVIQIRKVAITSSLITAIKRRNPLCLLNPMVFNLSW
jgi:hypothetical protein